MAKTDIALPVCQHKPAAYTGPSKAEVVALRQQYLTPALLTYYAEPLMLVEGHMQYVWDETGRRYLDGFASRWGTAIRPSSSVCVSRWGDCSTSPRSTCTPRSASTPKSWQQVSRRSEVDPTSPTRGSEANDLALLTARQYTGRFGRGRPASRLPRRVADDDGPDGALDVEIPGAARLRRPSRTSAVLLPAVPMARPTRAATCSAPKDVSEVIKFTTSGQIAAFIAEPMMGVGGVVTPPKE